MPNGPRIAPGSRVTLHLALSLPDGTEAYSSFAEDPIAAVIGDGTLDPGVELALYALRPGDTEHIQLQAGQAYGPHDPELVQELPLDSFPPGAPPRPGQLLAFTTPAGDELAGNVLEVNRDRVKIDFNHPLAGREIVVRAEILSVEAPPARPDDSE